MCAASRSRRSASPWRPARSSRCSCLAADELRRSLTMPAADPSAGNTTPGGNATPFLTDVQTLRERARRHMDQGAVTESYGADRDTVVNVLNQALATEIVCVL